MSAAEENIVDAIERALTRITRKANLTEDEIELAACAGAALALEELRSALKEDGS